LPATLKFLVDSEVAFSLSFSFIVLDAYP
jgi:hypothetical protein